MDPVQKGRFIVIEGLEGAGKSTAISTIQAYLKPYVSHLITSREPGGTELGEHIREMIKHINFEDPICAESELLLFYAARTQLIQSIIQPALSRGDWVLSDRFELSSLAYQGGGRQLDLKGIRQISDFCLHGIQPDLTIFLDLPPEQGLKRVNMRGEKDRMEQESIDFFHRVYETYQSQIRLLPNVVKIDATQSIEVVQQDVINALNKELMAYGIFNSAL